MEEYAESELSEIFRVKVVGKKCLSPWETILYIWGLRKVNYWNCFANCESEKLFMILHLRYLLILI